MAQSRGRDRGTEDRMRALLDADTLSQLEQIRAQQADDAEASSLLAELGQINANIERLNNDQPASSPKASTVSVTGSSKDAALAAVNAAKNNQAGPAAKESQEQIVTALSYLVPLDTPVLGRGDDDNTPPRGRRGGILGMV